MNLRNQEITLTQTIYASPSQVYAAFTSAQGWCEWCCKEAETEVKIGGKLHIFTEGYHANGEFKQLIPEHAVAFTWNGDNEPPTLIQVSLEERDNTTMVEFRVTGHGSEKDWRDIADFLERTWGRALNNLKVVLETKENTR